MAREVETRKCGHPGRIPGALWVPTSIWQNPAFIGADHRAQLAFFSGLSIIGHHGGGRDLICGYADWSSTFRKTFPYAIGAGWFDMEAEGLRVLRWFGCRVVPGRRVDERKPISLSTRQAVFARDGYRCVTCGAGENLHVDHIHPWSLGGPDTMDNFQTLCGSCNSRKGARV